VTFGKLPTTPETDKVIEHALEEARGLRHYYVGTEHVLLGLLREEHGLAAQILGNMHVNLDDVRQQVLDVVGQETNRAATDTRADAAFGDLSRLPDEVLTQIWDLDSRIAQLEEDREEAVAEQDFHRAIRLREEAAPLKSLRNDILRANLQPSQG
jgi:hypothetical protein